MRYEFQSGFVLEFKFEKTNFLHMVGIHKLIDIPLVQKFNSRKLTANHIISKIKNGTLTEALIKYGYRHLCVAGNKQNGFYPETFFFQPNDYYIKNQIHEKIKKIQIIKSDGTIFFEDEF